MKAAVLIPIASLTMGSGGVAEAPQEPAANTLEPVYVDTEQTDPRSEADPALETASEAEADLDAAASPTPAVRPDDTSETATTVSDEDATVEFALSDDYIQGRYYTGGGILGFDETKGHVGLYLSDNRDIIGNVGVMTDPLPLLDNTPLAKDGLTFSVGGRGYLALLSDPDDDVFGIAPGIEARYALPISYPSAVVGSLFYAPDILTLGDAENILDIDARFEAEVAPEIIGFIGIRKFRFDSDEGGNKDAAEEIQVGARFGF